MKTMHPSKRFPPSPAWQVRAAVALLVGFAAGGPAPAAGPAEPPIATLRPDYGRYIGDVRPLDLRAPHAGGADRIVYMALVRHGSESIQGKENAPLAGGARNDILYDPAAIGPERSAAWTLLLFDHEYFHARHLAGTTSLPMSGRLPAGVEIQFYEAAAWGFNVAEARAGRYPGLLPGEFREALDHYGEHYAALRALTMDGDPALWQSLSDLLRRPPFLVMMNASRPATDPARPSDWGRSTATPADTATRARAGDPGGTPEPVR